MENGAALKLPDAPQSESWYALMQALLALELVKFGLTGSPELYKHAELSIKQLKLAIAKEEVR